MRKPLFVFLSVICVKSILSAQALPLKQSFEGLSSDNWNFTTNPAAFNQNNDIWDRVDSSGYISGASDGSWFWESRDYDGVASGTAYLTFDTVDLRSEDACTLTFDYYAGGGLEAIDGIGYELVYDNSTTWESAINAELEQDTSEEWVTATISIPAEKDYLRIRLWAYTSAGTEYVGFDNIQLTAGETIVPELTIESPVDGAFYENTISNVTISGTATNISGVIVWSNALNSASGEFLATGEWSNVSVALAEGANEISVTATNANGLSAVERVTLLRGRLLASDGPGSIAFVAFNSAGDSFAFVALKDLPAGTVIRFCDEDWSGVDFGTAEDDLIWSNTTETVAGTVVAFYNCDSVASISNSIGVIINGKIRLHQEGDSIIAYYGEAEREPSAFLSAISTESGELRGTGLIYGETAVDISKSPTSQYYCGARFGEKAWSDYLPLINRAANWEGTAGITESWGDSTAFSQVKAGTVMLVN